jgi:putative ABC transport system permease protein
MRPRWTKIRRDVQGGAGRIGMILAALATGVAGVVTMLSAYAVLTREVPRNYIASNPASAQLVLRDSVTTEMVRRVRHIPGVALVSRAARVSGRIRVGADGWVPLLVFVVPEWEHETINLVRSEDRAWPRAGGMLVERSALELTGHKIGESITVDFGHNRVRVLPMSGTVHDPGVAPAWQEQVVYGYIEQRTLHALGVLTPLDILKFVATDSRSVPAISALADSSIGAVTALGGRVHEVHMPPPGRHPHQAQMNAVMTMLLIFSSLALALGAVLTASVIDGLLAQQVRQIAIMKAIGARSGQVAQLYLVLVAAIGLAALVLGIPIGIAAGQGLIRVTAQLLNLNIDSMALPWWLYGIATALGIGAPLLAAAVPIHAAARTTVRDGLDHAGAGAGAYSGARTRYWARRIRLGSPALDLAVRNLLRRRGRMLFAVSLLAVAGAMCITSLNLRAAWEDTVRESAADRHYDLEVRLEQPAVTDAALRAARTVTAVRAVEAWASSAASVATDGEVERTRSYPDGGHGGFGLRAAPPGTTLIAHRMSAGRWLTDDDRDAVVLNGLASLLAFPDKQPGDRISLHIGDSNVTYRLVGIVRENLTPGTAYVTPASFERATGSAELTNALRISLTTHTDANSAVRAITTALERDGIAVRQTISEARFGAAQGGHVYILIVALGLIAAIMSTVGLLGLSSSLGVSVVARTREFGIMRALGARSRSIHLMVVVEGILIAAFSWVVAVPASLLLSRVVGGVLARISTQQLVLRLSLPAAAAWLAVVLIAAALISLWPARRASRLTVRRALSFT